MSEEAPVYLFRRGGFAASESVVCVAPREIVASTFGAGGIKDTAGLIAAFGGAVVFGDEEGGRPAAENLFTAHRRRRQERRNHQLHRSTCQQF